MTSLEFLFNELWESPKDKLAWHIVLHKAKEMHNKEIEISDEEIDKAAIENRINYKQKYVAHKAFREGAKWYQEQLKNK